MDYDSADITSLIGDGTGTSQFLKLECLEIYYGNFWNNASTHLRDIYNTV